MTLDHQQLREDVNRPQLTPDIIDDFVTWLTEHGYDLYSFQMSDVSFKRSLFSQFWRQAGPDTKQTTLHFPE